MNMRPTTPNSRYPRCWMPIQVQAQKRTITMPTLGARAVQSDRVAKMPQAA